jgi:pimeloyl-ACP methyl ester carboxylesterase
VHRELARDRIGSDGMRRVLAAWQGAAAARLATTVEALGLSGHGGVAVAADRAIHLERCARRMVGLASSVPPAAWVEEGAGQGVVLVNGWTLSSRVWPAALVERLSASFSVVRPDNRGTGDRRRTPLPFTLADLADDVIAVVKAAGLSRPTIVGFSLGGMIATEVALRRPDVVGGLVLVSSRPPNPAQRAGRRGLVAQAFTAPALDRPLDEQLRERWGAVAAPGFADAHPERLAEMATSALGARTPRRTVRAQARAVAAWHGPRRLRAITAPTLVVHGADDPLSPPENSHRLVAAIPGAELVELAGVGHLVPQEAPERLAELIATHVHTVITAEETS